MLFLLSPSYYPSNTIYGSKDKSFKISYRKYTHLDGSIELVECPTGMELSGRPFQHCNKQCERVGEEGGGRTHCMDRTVASSLEVVRPYCIVITTTPTSAHSLVQVPHKCGTAMAVPAL